MKRKTIVAFAVVALANAIAGEAFAAAETGVMCNPATSADQSRVGYNQWGAHNISASLATVYCGGPTNAVVTVAPQVQVSVLDRNADVGQDTCCEGFLLSAAGTVMSQSGAVCAPSTFSNSIQTINLSFPSWTLGTVAMRCTIPAMKAGVASHVLTYRINN
jgi:hypothetical protein